MRFFVVLLLALSLGTCLAQDSIQYNADFEFYDGLYLSFGDFRNDNPIDFEQVVSFRKVDDPMFIDDLIKASTFRYRDGFGEVRELSTDHIWGFARRGKPFVVLNAQSYMGIIGKKEYANSGKNEYARFVELGEISLLQVNMMVQSPVQFYNQTGQFLFSMKTGKAVHYTLNNFEELIKEDEQLYKEFAGITSSKEKKEKFFLFLKRYNQKHPIYFPFFAE